MIISFLSDGLGNQMFQYAFARKVQHECNEKLKLNTYNFKKDLHSRSYSLNHFNIKDVTLCSKYEALYYKYLLIAKREILKRANKGLNENERYKKGVKHHGMYFSHEPYGCFPYEKTNKKTKLIEGFFQSHKNFDDIKDIIVEELTVTTLPSSDNKKLLEKIAECENPVCVHIRRGDYVNNPRWSKSLAICDYDYYKKAMKIIADKVNNPTFFIFSNTSDDINFIKENYKFDHQVEYVDLNNPDYEELRLMYSCNHFIISNSTFSWWGQYLSRNTPKIVVAPSVWNRQRDAKNIYMDNWITVEV